MQSIDQTQGVTLLETLIALSLLVAVAAGAAQLLVFTRRLFAQAERDTAAIAVAVDRMERLRAVPWRYSVDGTAPEMPLLAPSPPGTLDQDMTGFFEHRDAAGQMLGDDGAPPSFTCRWAIVPLMSDDDARGLEVCVFDWPDRGGTHPIVCLVSARGRQS